MICFVVRSRTKALCHSPQVGRSRIPCQILQTLVAAGLKRTKIISFPHKPNRFSRKNDARRIRAQTPFVYLIRKTVPSVP